MDAKTATEIRRRAMRIAKKMPGTKQMVPGEARRAILVVLKEEQAAGRHLDVTDEEAFYREVWRKSIRANVDSASPKHDPDDLNGRNRTGFLGRYRTLVDKHNSLPTDELIMDEWGCADGTLSSIRSRLKDMGYRFERLPEGTWRVVSRPAPPPPPVAPSAPITEPPIETPAQKPLPLVSDVEQLGAMVHELLALSKAQLQMQAGTYRKLGELVELVAKAWQAWQ